MAFHVTQCPSCDSTFNTSARLLQSADGKVRCGACLTVFAAAENFVTSADTDTDSGDQESVFLGNNPIDFFDPSLFLTRGSLTEADTAAESRRLLRQEIAAALSRDTDAAALSSPVATDGGTTDDPHPDMATEANAATADSEFYDITEMEPEDDSEPEPATVVTASATDTSSENEFQEAVARGADDAADASLDLDLATATAPPADFDTTLIDLDEVTTEESVPDSPDFVAAPMPPPTVADPDPVAAAVFEEDSTAAIRDRARRMALHDERALEALPATARTSIGGALPPLELLSGNAIDWGRRLLLLTLTVFLLTTLALQFLWQHLPTYSQLPRLRPLYELACGYVQCELPAYTNIGAIRNDNLQVRSHPEVENALVVSLSFRNTADFPQAFPVLILSFNSATNAVIALREFAPAEYLEAGLQGIEMMPVMTPVQVNLEIMDPGRDAVNYTVAFRRR